MASSPPRSLPLLLVRIVCVLSGNANVAFLHPSSLSRPSITMQQQPTAVESDDASSSSTTLPLFSTTSKFHPDRGGLARRRRWLVVDFDGTCTAHDTTPLLPQLAAYATRRRRSSEAMNGNNESVGREEANFHRDDLQRRILQFQKLEKRYFELLKGEKKLHLSSEGSEVGDLHDALDALDRPSNLVTDMVSESGVLMDLGHVDACELGEILDLGTEGVDDGDDYDTNNNDSKDQEAFEKVSVRLRKGCEVTLARILSDEHTKNRKEQDPPPSCLGWSLAVLSINWCPALIDAAVVRPVLERKHRILRLKSCDTEVPVWSNSVDGNGAVSLHVPGALAKRDRIVELRSRILQSSPSANGNGTCSGMIVYVGDSTTDLAALLEADVGILIGNSGTTIAMAERWGVKILPLQNRKRCSFGSGSYGGGEEGKQLWRAESWREIDDALRELDERLS